jgi:hypothetical protein
MDREIREKITNVFFNTFNWNGPAPVQNQNGPAPAQHKKKKMGQHRPNIKWANTGPKL